MKSVRRLASLIAITAALTVGCRTSEPTGRAAVPATTATTTPAPTAPLAAYVFDCEGGTSLILAMNKGGTGADEAIDLGLPDRHYRLPRVISPSGVHYPAGNVSV